MQPSMSTKMNMRKMSKIISQQKGVCGTWDWMSSASHYNSYLVLIMISQTLSLVYVVIIWLTRRKNIHSNISYQYSPEYILSVLYIESHKLSPSQYSKIGILHNTVVGHYGLERTLKRFKDLNDTWEYQRQHIRYYIDHCPCCQKMNMLKIPIHAHGFTTSKYTPIECRNIDFIGPFPDQGYILVIVDTFTR